MGHRVSRIRPRGRAESAAEFWGRVIEEWSGSGQTQAEFCRRRGLAVGSLRWWRWELRRRGAVLAPEPESEGRSLSALPSFLPIRIVGTDRAAGSSAWASDSGSDPGSGCAFEVVLAGGARVRVWRGFQAAELEQVLVAVEAAQRC